MEIQLLYFDGCPNWQLMDERLRALTEEFGLRIVYRTVESPEEATALGFRGSPTVLVDGRDPFADDDAPVGLACRVYPTPDGPAGAPTMDQLRAALRHPLVRRSRLWRAGAAVLDAHWIGASTVPSLDLYPHQWSWDSAFVAVGLRHLSAERAQRELETLFDAQWDDGRVPHIVFNPQVPEDAYFPGPSFWRVGTYSKSSGVGVSTSGIVQPPVHALAAWEVHLADPVLSGERAFLAGMYPKLVSWHGYLRQRRNLGGHGLAAVVHPWETGMDNSVCWDGPLARVTPADARDVVRRDLREDNVADRPTDEDYRRYIGLAARYRDAGYDDAEGAHEFLVEDPMFNALLALGEVTLAEIAAELGDDTGADAHRAAARSLTAAMLEVMWDASRGFFFPRDLRSREPIVEYACTGAVPLALPGIAVAEQLVTTLRGTRFRIEDVVGVPSYDLTSDQFDPSRYWRGPSWFNIGWLVHRGLREHGQADVAERLGGSLLDAADRSDFAEYIDPLTGDAHGTRPFSWTAAVALDLLAADVDSK
jgi:hypothetical protein